MKEFQKLGLNDEMIKGLEELGFTEPSPIQEKTIPFILESTKDLIALAQTGTGKTGAFSLPILNQIKEGEKALQAIILCPTRELCLQISQDIKKFAKHSKNITTTAVYGGEKIDLQIRALKSGTNIVVGTPGRVHDLIRRKILKLQSIKWLVLDEADEMLDMGFKNDLDIILKETPSDRQTLLFSATISKSVHAIAQKYMHDATEISMGEKNIGADKVSHEYYMVQNRDRFEALKRILDYLPGVYGIIFCRTKRETQEIADKLKQANYNTEALHGDVTQTMRTKIMDRFKRKQISILVATDVAARGIDVNDLTHVINYNLPEKNEGYTHRSGRTGRAQKSGVAISLVNFKDVKRIRGLESTIGKLIDYKKVPNGKEVCLKQIDNFIDEVEKVNIKNINDEEYFLKISEKLKKITKEDLIKHFVAHKLSHLMDNYNDARDLNASADNSFSARKKGDEERNISLKINIGKKHGIDIKGLFSLLNSNKKLKGIEVGKVDLRDDYSVFSVDKNRSDDVLKYLDGNDFRGNKIEVTRSSAKLSYSRASHSKPSYSKKRSNRPNRSFDKKRSGGYKKNR